MNTNASLRQIIHREMRAHFSWHRIDKLDPEGNGYVILVSVHSNPREYMAAADLTAALKRHYHNVHLSHTASYVTANQDNIYSISITCSNPKVVDLPVSGRSWNTTRAA